MQLFFNGIVMRFKHQEYFLIPDGVKCFFIKDNIVFLLFDPTRLDSVPVVGAIELETNFVAFDQDGELLWQAEHAYEIKKGKMFYYTDFELSDDGTKFSVGTMHGAKCYIDIETGKFLSFKSSGHGDAKIRK
jgi:hypothetical protein